MFTNSAQHHNYHTNKSAYFQKPPDKQQVAFFYNTFINLFYAYLMTHTTVFKFFQ